jgi:hypothetical protein
MQVGDLVTLSAAGKKNQGNVAVIGLLGVITKIKEHTYPYEIRWWNAPRGDCPNGLLSMKRYEIKKV